MMRSTRRVLLCACISTMAVVAQPPTAPVVNPRGVINAFTQQPAPSRVAPGGIIWISGINLGPPGGAKATGVPLPTRLADPPVEVMINGRMAPLFSVSPARIVAQVPWEMNQGLAQIVVRRGGAQSRPARIFIDTMRPSVRTAGDQGFGPAAATLSGRTLSLTATGLGLTEPRVESGAAGPSDPALPRADLRAFVGGLHADVSAMLSTERVGEFDIRIELPADAQPGDVISIEAANQSANRTIYQKASSAEVRFLALPEGTFELRGISGSDLRGGYLFMSGARDASGCWPSYLFDFARARVSSLDGCLTSANRNAPTPFMPANEGAAVGALVGPPEADPPAGVSSRLQVYAPAKDSPMMVELPSAASGLGTAPGGNLLALLAGTPPHPVVVDAETGEISEPSGGGAGPGGGGAGVILNPNFTIDLGDGIKELLSVPMQVGQGTLAIVVGDHADTPSKAKLALLDPRGDVVGTRDFPEGWMPLVGPRSPNQPGGGPGPGGPGPGLPGPVGPGGGGGAQVAARFRVSITFDPQPARVLYVLSRKGDAGHGIVAFTFDDNPAKAIEFPASTFAAACTSSIPIFNLELARRIAIPATNVNETQFRNPCPALGYILMDLASQSVTAVQLPGSGELSANSLEDLNDYIYGTNTDPSRQNRADTLYVLDGVTASSFRLDLPPEVATFTNLTPVPLLGVLVGLAANRIAGDAGLIVFDMDQASARLLPTPEGFAQVQPAGIFTTTRKIVARATRTGNSGSQFVIYDLTTGDLAMPANPAGCNWVGQQQQGPPQPGGPAPIPALQIVNTKANTVSAICYSEDRKQTGVLSLRIP